MNKNLKLCKEEAKDFDKKGRLIPSPDMDGNPRYVRNDIIGLMSLLGKFDTRKHGIDDWKVSIKIKDKLIEAHHLKAEKLELSEDEAKFLLSYLQGLKDKDAKDQPISDFELRTLFGILEQMGD